MILQDAMQLQGTTRNYTDEGYLEAVAVICRTGMYDYQGSELPGFNLDPNKTYKIYRPESSVFEEKAMDSFKRRPVTNEHPYDVGGLLSTDTAQKKTVGTSGDNVRRVGNTIVVDMTIWDKSAIEDIEAGKDGLSNGYTLDLDMTEGVTPWGEPYDGIQTNIRGNHIAVCANNAARGGSQCKLLDKKTQEFDTMKQDAAELPNLSDLSQLGQMIQMILAKLDALAPSEDKPADPAPADNGDGGSDDGLEGLDGDEAMAVDEGDMPIEATDAKKEVESLKGQLAAYKALDMKKLVNEQVNSRVALLDKARKVIPALDNSLTDLDIQKSVIAKLNPGISLDRKNAEYISGCFDAAITTYVEGAQSAADLGKAINLSKAQSGTAQDSFSEIDSGAFLEAKRAARNERLRNAYKGDK